MITLALGKLGVVDREGRLHAEGLLRTTDHETLDGFVRAMAAGCRDCLVSVATPHQVQAVGIGAPNGNYYRGTVEDPPNLRWQGVLPLAELVSKELGLPTWLTNDANAAALGELLYGGGRGARNLLVVTLGTGVGSGYIVDGKLLYGHTGFAGELGHMVVKPGGRQCGCGRQGCLEKYGSVTGLVLTAQEKLAGTTTASSLRGLPGAELTGAAIHDAAKAGDALALEVYEETAEVLGFGLANTVVITSPEKIFLFGGLAHSGDLLLVPTRRAFEAHLHRAFTGVSLEISALQDRNGGILGAAALAFHEQEAGGA
ncbi:MAG: ROK family protein [Planctomycetota bacterium]|jgi:glucokinase